MRLTVCVVTFAIAVFLVRAHAQKSPDHIDTRRETLEDLSDNIRVRLVAAKISKSRGQYLEILVVRLDGAGETERLGFRFPAHSHTPHEATLAAIVKSCVTLNEPKFRYEWQQTTNRAVFLIPKDAQQGFANFEKWRLVSLQCSQDD